MWTELTDSVRACVRACYDSGFKLKTNIYYLNSIKQTPLYKRSLNAIQTFLFFYVGRFVDIRNVLRALFKHAL